MLKMLLAFTCLTLSIGANAAALTWTLQNVFFDDGGTANGSYTYDATAGTYSNININTTAGTALPAQSYTTLRPGSGTLDFGFSLVDVVEADMTDNPLLNLTLVSSMTEAGGTIAFGINGSQFPWEGTCFDSGCTLGIPNRTITSGSVSTVPLPAAAWLFGSALLGLAGVARRKKA